MGDVLLRYCSSCKGEIIHKNIKSFKRAIKLKRKCRKCSQNEIHKNSTKRDESKWILICNNCKETKKFKSYSSFKNSERVEKYVCRKCSYKELSKRPEVLIHLKKISFEGGKKRGLDKRSNYDIWLEKYGKEIADIKHSEFLTKMSFKNHNVNNPMYGKNFYDIWLEKYGKEIADERLKNFKEKQSLWKIGIGNPMYGKPSPVGSGNGWSGWYKGWFFRSLLELSYMINIIERYNINWETGEKKKWAIKYKNKEGRISNYFPDFILEGKYIIECKPKALWGTDINKAKYEKAREFCLLNNMKFKLIDPIKISFREIKKLHSENIIKFIEKYERRIRSRL